MHPTPHALLGASLLALSTLATAQATALGGVASDLTLSGATCRNLSTGQKVKVRRLDADGLAFDCTGAGLAAQDGESITITLTGQASSGRPPLGEGLLARYALNGDARDSGGHGFDGQVEQAQPAPDKQNRAAAAMAFDGASSRIRLPPMPSPTSNTYSVSAWILPTACETRLDGTLLASATWSPGKVALSLRTVDGTCRLHAAEYDTQPDRRTGPVRVEFYSGFTVLMNQWQHVTWTMDASRMQSRFFLNGEGEAPIGFANLNGLTAPDFSDLAIGDFAMDGRHFRGLIDEVRIYGGRALTPTQVKAIYNAGT